MAPTSAKTSTPGLGRRDLLTGALGSALTAAVACGGAPRPVSSASPAPRALSRSAPPIRGTASVWSWFDLPEDPRSRELSGITWDPTTGTVYAVQDDTANIVSLVPSPDLRTWTFGPVIRIVADFPLDLEGIAAVPGGFVVCSEIGARILDVDRAGRIRDELRVPAHFGTARHNKSLESLTLAPSKRVLFTTSESALDCDGLPASTDSGTRVRIVRFDRGTKELTEHAYASDPAHGEGGDYGIADLAALEDDELLVLERGWVKGQGNAVRVYRTRIEGSAAACTGRTSLVDYDPVLPKALVVDLARVVARDVPPARQPQASDLLDNFEGMAIGPRLPDGRASLLLVSDDNARADQVARVVVLAFG